MRGAVRKAEELARTSPGLVLLGQEVEAFGRALAAYDGLVADTRVATQSIAAHRAALDEAAEAYMGACFEFVGAQSRLMTEDVGAASGSARLLERLKKITLVNDVIDLGNEARVTNYKAQAERDADGLLPALAELERAAAKLDELQPLTRLSANLEQIARVRQAAQACAVATAGMKTDLERLEQLLVAREKRAATLMSSAREIALAGSQRTQEAAVRSVSALALTQQVLAGGLLVALILGVVITVRLTRGITLPLFRALELAGRMAKGDFTSRLDVTSGDELGDLAGALNATSESLREQVVAIRQYAEQLAAAGGEISTTVSELAASSMQTANAVTETGATTAEIQGILGDTQKSTSAAVMATEEGTKAVDAGLQQATAAGEVIYALAESIEAAAEAAAQISAASQQQMVGMDQASNAMDSIKKASTDNAGAARELERAAHSLSDIGQELRGLVQRYRV